MQVKSDRMAKNSLIVFIGRISELLIRIVSIILIARYLGVEEFGKYAFVRGIGIVVTVIIAWANLMIIIREVAVDRAKASVILTSALVLHITMGIIMMMITSVVIFCFIETEFKIAICIFLVFTAQTLFVMQRSVSSMFIAFEKVIFDSIITIFNRVSAFLLFLGVIFFDLQIVGFFYASIVASLLGLCLSFILVYRHLFIPKPIFNIQTIVFIFKESLSLCISNLIVSGYNHLNIFFLKAFHGPVQISFFNTPQRFIEPLKLFPRSVMIAVMPTLSALGRSENTKANLLSLYRTILKTIIIICIPLFLCLALYALPIITFVFGKDFSGAAVPLQIWSWALLPLFINILNVNVLTAITKQQVLIISNGVCFVVVCVSGYLIIPQYAAVGASIALACGNLFLFSLNFYFIFKYLGPINIYSIAIRPLIACIMMFLTCTFLGNVSALIIFPFSLLIYFCMLIILKTFSSQEISFFKQIIPKIAIKKTLCQKKI